MSRLAAAQQDRLSSKELAALSESVQLYDTGKYRSSLRAAESVLAGHPNHAEALAVQALCRAQFPSTVEQSIDIARRATVANFRSVLCWHSLAICYRKNRKFAESLKAYTHAAHLDPSSFMMVREAALMSVLLRQHTPVIDLRLTVLRMQPHVRTSWTQLAVSHHLAGSLQQAIRVLEEYQDTIKEHPARSQEQSETWLYHATLLFEAERYEDVLNLLSARADEVLDINARSELAAQCHAKLGKLAEAEKEYRFLLERNPHSAAYVQGYLLSKGVDPAVETDQSIILPLIEELESAWPDSLAIRAASFKLLSGPEFEKRVETHLIRACQKGVPSLFNALKQYYAHADKRQFIGAVAEKHRLAWQAAAVAAEDDPTESPSAYLWSLYFLAQHYSYLGDGERAKAYIQSAIAHTPTLPELHMTRARILKRTGDLCAAATAAETARLLDGQDRYVNCKSVKYALRINDVDTAVDLASKFTMKINGSPSADLIDLQAFWFMTEEAAAFLRRGDYAMALKRLTSIEETKDQLWYDQVDFHFWSVRKFNLRAYMNAMRYWDSTRSHPAAVQAALELVNLCLRLHDHPELVQEQLAGIAAEVKAKDDNAEAPTAKFSASQKKRLKAKQKADAAKKAEEEAKNEDTEPKLPDPDPKGIEALKALKPLSRAQQTCELLQQYASDNVHTWLATFEWAVRAENWLVAVRAAKQVQRLDPTHPGLHLAVLKLALGKPHIASEGKSVETVLEEALASLVPGPAESIHAEFVQQRPNSPAHTLAAAQGLLLLAPPRKGEPSARRDEVIELVMSLPKHAVRPTTPAAHAWPHIDGLLSPYKDPSLLALVSGLNLLRDPAVAAPVAAVEEYLSAARQVWPNCDSFKDETTLKAEAEERSKARKGWEAVADDARNGAARHTL